MYGVGGERDLDEQMLDHLQRLRAAPGRCAIGNGAYDQRQHDVWGAVLDSVLHPHHVRATGSTSASGRSSSARSRRRSRTGASPTGASGRCAASRKHFTSSKVMCWVAARPRRPAGPAARGARAGRAVAGGRRRDPRRHLRQRRRRARRVHPALRAPTALDASLLLMPLVGFLPADDPRVRATVLAIADELTDDGLVLRYRVEETDDGLDRRGGHVHDLLVLAGVGAGRDRRARAGPRSCARSCCRSPARSASTPRRSTRTAAATSATSRRRSPTWR